MKSFSERIIVPAIAVLGLAFGISIISWIVGTFGVSTVTAQAIVKAVEVGSWGMFLVSLAATGGLIGAGLWGALKLMVKQVGKKAAIA